MHHTLRERGRQRGVLHGWRWSAVDVFEWTAAGFNWADSWLLAARGEESVLQPNRCAAIRTAGGSRLVASAVFERNNVRWRIRLRMIGWQICVILRTSCVLGALASKHLLAAHSFAFDWLADLCHLAYQPRAWCIGEQAPARGARKLRPPAGGGRHR